MRPVDANLMGAGCPCSLTQWRQACTALQWRSSASHAQAASSQPPTHTHLYSHDGTNARTATHPTRTHPAQTPNTDTQHGHVTMGTDEHPRTRTCKTATASQVLPAPRPVAESASLREKKKSKAGRDQHLGTSPRDKHFGTTGQHNGTTPRDSTWGHLGTRYRD